MKEATEIKEIDKQGLLILLKDFLKHNAKARKAQKLFEMRLKELLGLDELNDVMDWYIDLEESGVSKATIHDIEIILKQAKEGTQWEK